MDGWMLWLLVADEPGLEDLGEAPLVRDWRVCRAWRLSCCPRGEIPAFVPQSLLPRGTMWDGAVRSCSVCSHVFLLPLLLSPRRPQPLAGAAPPPLLRLLLLGFLTVVTPSCLAQQLRLRLMRGALPFFSTEGQGSCSGSLGFGLWSELLGTMTFLTEPLPFIARHFPKTAGLIPSTCIFICFRHNLLNLLALSSALW